MEEHIWHSWHRTFPFGTVPKTNSRLQRRCLQKREISLSIPRTERPSNRPTNRASGEICLYELFFPKMHTVHTDLMFFFYSGFRSVSRIQLVSPNQHASLDKPWIYSRMGSCSRWQSPAEQSAQKPPDKILSREKKRGSSIRVLNVLLMVMLTTIHQMLHQSAARLHWFYFSLKYHCNIQWYVLGTCLSFNWKMCMWCYFN